MTITTTFHKLTDEQYEAVKAAVKSVMRSARVRRVNGWLEVLAPKSQGYRFTDGQQDAIREELRGFCIDSLAGFNASAHWRTVCRRSFANLATVEMEF